MRKIIFLFFLSLNSILISAEEKSVTGILVGHIAPVSSLSCSPSGKYLASASEDRTIRIWRLTDNKCEMVLSGHLEPVWSVAYSPDGKYLASGSDDNTVRIWNTNDGACIKILTGHTKYVVSVAFSPDGKYVASGSMDKSVKIWQLSDSECIRSFSQHADPVVSISYSPDGKFIAAGSGQIIKIWQVSNGTCIGSLTGHSDFITNVTFSPNGRYVASAGGQTIKIWRVGNWECIDTLTGHESDIKAVSYSSDGEYLASCDESGRIKIWDISSGNNIKNISVAEGTNSICFSRDGKSIISGYKSGVIEIRKFSIVEEIPKQIATSVAAPNTVTKRSKQPKKEIPAKKTTAEVEEKAAIAVATQAAEMILNTASVNEKQNIETANTTGEILQQQQTAGVQGELPQDLQSTEKKKSPNFLIILSGIILLALIFLVFFFIAISRAKYATLPRKIAKNISEGKIEQATELFIKYQSGFFNKKPNIKKLPPEVLFKIYLHRGLIENLLREEFPINYIISFTKLFIETRKYEKAYELSQKFSLQELTAAEIFAMYTAIGKANDITPGIIPISYFLEYVKMILEQGNKNEAYKMLDKYRDYIFNGKTFGKETYMFVKEHTHSVSSICSTPDGQYMATASFDKTIKIWQVKNKKCVKTLIDNSDWIYSISYSPSGKHLIAGLGNGTIKIWATNNYECIRSIEAHKDSVMSVTFSQDGFFFLSGGADNIIKIWDIETAECLKLLKGHTGWVKTVVFSPDGKLVISGSADNTLKIWNIATGENIKTLEGHSWGGINSVAFSYDNKYLASASDDKTIRIWQAENYECVTTIQGHKNNVLSVSFSYDNNYIISASADKTIKMWQMPSFECIKTIEGNSNSVMSVCFSPDNNYIAAGNADQTVKVWELKKILLIDENIIRRVFEIYEKSGNLEQLCSSLTNEKVNPKIYNLISELLYKANEFDKAQSVLKAKQNFYSTSTPAEGIPPESETPKTDVGIPQELPEKYHEELTKSLKSMEKENKDNY